MSALRGRLPSTILVHTATPVSYQETQSDPAEWIEGEPGPQGGGTPVQGAPFPCVLFMPSPGGEQQNQYRPRTVQSPTILYNPSRKDGSAVLLANEDEVLILAPELATWTGGVDQGRWLVVGEPQAFGKPGYIYGVQATVRSVID
jgi:hypothetical protein